MIVAETMTQVNVRSSSIISKFCQEHLTTIEGYQRAVRNLFGFDRMIPVVLSEQEIYFPTMSIYDHDVIWINYQAISNVIFDNDQMKITFYDNDKLIIPYSKWRYRATQKKIAIIRKHLNW